MSTLPRRRVSRTKFVVSSADDETVAQVEKALEEPKPEFYKVKDIRVDDKDPTLIHFSIEVPVVGYIHMRLTL